jgi:hypothetical protein
LNYLKANFSPLDALSDLNFRAACDVLRGKPDGTFFVRTSLYFEAAFRVLISCPKRPSWALCNPSKTELWNKGLYLPPLFMFLGNGRILLIDDVWLRYFDRNKPVPPGKSPDAHILDCIRRDVVDIAGLRRDLGGRKFFDSYEAFMAFLLVRSEVKELRGFGPNESGGMKVDMRYVKKTRLENDRL